MAKEDFCFTYYDGDAARDKAHMNRLERGAYDDIISAQRKRGHLSIDDIKRVLSKDFETCWSAMEWILIKDEEGKFFIEWVEKSISEMKKNSTRNKEQLEKYWQEVNSGLRPAPKNGRKKQKLNTEEIQTYLTGIKKEIPLVDGDVNGVEYLGKSENLLKPKPSQTSLVGEMQTEWKTIYPDAFIDDSDPANLFEIAGKIHEWQKLPDRPLDNKEQILLRWGEIANHCRADSHLKKYSISQVNKHFSSVIQSFKNGNDKNNNPERIKSSASAERNAARAGY